jgi:O-antigen ligase
LWKAGAIKIAETPVFGTGFVSKMQGISTLMPEHVAYLQFTHLHNIFIDAGVAMGLPGMLLVVAIMLAAVRMVSALSTRKRQAGYAFLALCLLHGSLGPIFTHDIVVSIFIVVLSVFASCLGREIGHRA